MSFDLIFRGLLFQCLPARFPYRQKSSVGHLDTDKFETWETERISFTANNPILF